MGAVSIAKQVREYLRSLGVKAQVRVIRYKRGKDLVSVALENREDQNKINLKQFNNSEVIVL